MRNDPLTGIDRVLRQAREGKGMTRSGLAKLTGISANTLAKYETPLKDGGKLPSLSRMVQLASVLVIDPRKLFDYILNQTTHDNDEWSDAGFSFSNHFATDSDFLNWKLSTQNIEDLNAHLEVLSDNFWKVRKQVSDIHQHLKKNDPDYENPGHSQISTNRPEAAPTASPDNKKGNRR